MTSQSLFAVADYRRLWAAGALSGVARWLEFIALGIYAWEVTNSAPLVALLAVLRMAPYVALGFIIGALADRFDRRRLLMTATFITMATAAAMCLATSTGIAGYAAVAAATAVSGAFWTIDMPVRRRLLVDSVGQDRLPKALGYDNSTNYATRALGPLVGGGAYQALGIGGIYALIALGYLACLALAWRLDHGREAPSAAATAGGWLTALRIPRELVLNRRFAVIMGVTFVYNVTCFPFTTMVPVIAQKDFGLSPFWVGALSACDGIGGTLGALLVGAFASERTLFRFYFFGVTTILMLMFFLSMYLTVEATVAMLLLTGIAAAGFSATQYALVHIISPPEVRGRATGVLSMFIGSALIGHWVSGQLFGHLTSAEAMRFIAVFGVSLMTLLGLVWWGKR